MRDVGVVCETEGIALLLVGVCSINADKAVLHSYIFLRLEQESVDGHHFLAVRFVTCSTLRFLSVYVHLLGVDKVAGLSVVVGIELHPHPQRLGRHVIVKSQTAEARNAVARVAGVHKHAVHLDAVDGIGVAVESHESLGTDVVALVVDAKRHVRASESLVALNRKVERFGVYRVCRTRHCAVYPCAERTGISSCRSDGYLV